MKTHLKFSIHLINGAYIFVAKPSASQPASQADWQRREELAFSIVASLLCVTFRSWFVFFFFSFIFTERRLKKKKTFSVSHTCHSIVVCARIMCASVDGILAPKQHQHAGIPRNQSRYQGTHTYTSIYQFKARSPLTLVRYLRCFRDFDWASDVLRKVSFHFSLQHAV